MEKKELEEKTLDHKSITRTISSVMQPKQPSREFMNRVKLAAQKRFRKQESTER